MLRIGKIRYANLYPLFYTLERQCQVSQYTFIEGVPSEINRLLREGIVDISPSSSIEYLRSSRDYTLIEGHSISSVGPIQSILLFSTLPMKDLDGTRVLASAQSETSTALMRIILKKFYRCDVQIISSNVELKEGLRDFAAYMLIGDDALREGANPAGRGPSSYVFDLGEIWYRETGLPFVFALWIARKSCCTPEGLDDFTSKLDDAKRFARNNLSRIADASPFAKILGREKLVRYWENISYDLDSHHKEGLRLFGQLLGEEDIS